MARGDRICDRCTTAGLSRCHALDASCPIAARGESHPRPANISLPPVGPIAAGEVERQVAGARLRLTELEPRWVHDNVFVFRCPHCRETWLSCKNVAMSIGEQFDLFRAADLNPHGPRYAVVPMNEAHAWSVSGRDFETMTVTPSIDASASGHWHGFITAGAIVGGEQQL